MNTNTLEAKPVSYLSDRSGVGKVQLVATQGPPLSVKPWENGQSGDMSLCIEFEDIEKLVEMQNGLTKDSVLRLCLHIPDARKLTCHLIYALANTNDRVASRLVNVLNEFFEKKQLTSEEQKPSITPQLISETLLQMK